MKFFENVIPTAMQENYEHSKFDVFPVRSVPFFREARIQKFLDGFAVVHQRPPAFISRLNIPARVNFVDSNAQKYSAGISSFFFCCESVQCLQ